MAHTTNLNSYLTETPWVTQNDIFSEDELDFILSVFGKMQHQNALLLDESGVRESRSYRTGTTTFVHSSQNEFSWIFSRISMVVDVLNDQFFHYDIHGYDNIQYAEYPAEVGGHYDWHVDISIGANREQSKIFGAQHRKISISILLNDDFEGGEFDITLDGGNTVTPLPLKRNSALAFPSFVCHRVRPVTSGTRKSIVCWVLGPKFR